MKLELHSFQWKIEQYGDPVMGSNKGPVVFSDSIGMEG